MVNFLLSKMDIPFGLTYEDYREAYSPLEDIFNKIKQQSDDELKKECESFLEKIPYRVVKYWYDKYKKSYKDVDELEDCYPPIYFAWFGLIARKYIGEVMVPLFIEDGNEVIFYGHSFKRIGAEKYIAVDC